MLIFLDNDRQQVEIMLIVTFTLSDKKI